MRKKQLMILYCLIQCTYKFITDKKGLEKNGSQVMRNLSDGVTAGTEAEDRTFVEVALLAHPKETFRSEVSYVAVSSSIFSTRLCGI